MSTVCTFINAAAASSTVRPTAAAASSSRRASSTVVRASADKSSTSVVLGGVTPLPSARAARVHRRRGAVVMRAEDGLQRDNPELEEKFATIGSGEHECQSCMYTYVPSNGDDFYPVSPGTAFKNLPEDWRCPTCGAEKSKFKNMGKQVAGFEQNQGYGFGTNSMTGGEKSVLIYGVLGIFFLFFIGGYLLD